MTTVTSHQADLLAFFEPPADLVSATLLMTPIAAVFALAAILSAARRAGGGLGNGWTWIAAGLIGNWATDWLPGSSIALVPSLLSITGVVLLGSRTIRSRLGDVADGFILALGLAAIVSTVCAGRSLPTPITVTLSDSAHLVIEVALIAVAGLTLLRTRSAALVQLCAAMALLGVSDLAHAAAEAAAHPSMVSALSWTSSAGYLALAMAARPERHRSAHPAADAGRLAGIDPRPHRLYVLSYLPLAAALGTAIVQRSLGVTPTSTTISLLLAAAGLTLARQHLTLKDNRRLADAVLAGRSDLHRQSQQDPVTGLANRALFSAALAEALVRRAETRRSVAVLLCGVDGFRSLNDALGQAVGDRVLAEVGARIRREVGPGSLVARLGGDEFAVLMEDLNVGSGSRRANAAAVNLQDQLATTCAIDGVQVSLSVAVGAVVVHPDQPAAGVDEVVGRADIAMHVAKRTIRRRPVLHHDGMSLPDDQDWQLRPAFGQALRSGSVTPHFQPLVDLETGRIRAFEALARWTHDGQVTGPDVFLPVAARAGLLPELARQMLRAATEQLLTWRARPDLAELQVAVNVSPAQIVDSTFPDLVSQVLDEVGLPPAGLVLEITEESLLDDPDGAARVVLDLRQLGVTVWLDDFGAGYSSLALLHRLPLQAIKIDKSLVRNVDIDPHLRRLVSSLVSLGADLGLEVIAEGIQRRDQERTLRHLGCALGQGYLFAPAGTGAECERLLDHPVLRAGTATAGV